METESFTMPPPMTLSYSDMPVTILSLELVFMLFNLSAMMLLKGVSPLDAPAPGLKEETFTVSSTNVFHLPHSGHFPIHLGVAYPHSEHTKLFFSFIINSSL